MKMEEKQWQEDAFGYLFCVCPPPDGVRGPQPYGTFPHAHIEGQGDPRAKIHTQCHGWQNGIAVSLNVPNNPRHTLSYSVKQDVIAQQC